MKVKKILLSLAMVASILGTVVMPVSAKRSNEVSRAESFMVYINGGSVLSSVAIRKGGDGRTMGYYARERRGTNIRWYRSETVNLRGRTERGARCTDLAQQNTEGGGDMSYYSGYGHKNHYYKLAVQYDDNNPYRVLDLRCRWTL